MATLTISPSLHGWQLGDVKEYNFYGVNVKVTYQSAHCWVVGYTDAAGELLGTGQTSEAGRVIPEAREACRGIALAALSSGTYTLAKSKPWGAL